MDDATHPEIWRPVVGFEGRYEVSDRGRVRSLLRCAVRILQQQRGSGGYAQVGLYPESAAKVSRTVHSLVAEVWLGPRPPQLEIRHLNGDRRDPRLANLAYGTASENQRDSVRHGTQKETRKTQCPHGHPYDRRNTLITRDGKRKCRACGRSRRRAQYARSKHRVI